VNADGLGYAPDISAQILIVNVHRYINEIGQ